MHNKKTGNTPEIIRSLQKKIVKNTSNREEYSVILLKWLFIYHNLAKTLREAKMPNVLYSQNNCLILFIIWQHILAFFLAFPPK